MNSMKWFPKRFEEKKEKRNVDQPLQIKGFFKNIYINYCMEVNISNLENLSEAIDQIIWRV